MRFYEISSLLSLLLLLPLPTAEVAMLHSLTLRCAPLLLTALLLPQLAQAKITQSLSPGDSPDAVAKGEIARARGHIDVILPDLNDKALVKALTEAAKSDKTVRIVTASRAVGAGKTGKAARCKACDWLELAGADVRHVDLRVLERTIVLDGPRSASASGAQGKVLVMSGSLGTKGRDQSLVVFEKEGDFALSYQDEFNHLWSKAQDYDDAARKAEIQSVRVPTAPFVLFSSANMVPLELPSESGKPSSWMLTPSLDKKAGVLTDSLAKAIDQAYDSVDVSSPQLRSKEIYAALVKASARGIRIRVLLDAKEFSGELKPSACVETAKLKAGKVDECLSTQDAFVRYVAKGKGSPALESQYLIIDGRTVLTGNFAWSRRGELSSLGHVVTLRGETARAYKERFNEMFAGAKSPFKKAPSLAYEATRLRRGCGDVMPVSYSFSEMTRMRQAYREGDCAH